MSNIFSISLSLFLLATGIYIYRKTNPLTIIRFFFSAIVFVSLIYYLIYGASYYFTGNGIDDSVIFHLNYGLGGAGVLEYLELIVTSIVFIILSLAFSYWVSSRKAKYNTNRMVYIYAAYSLVFASLLFNPATSDVYNLLSSKSGTPVIKSDSPDIKPNSSDFNYFYREPYITRKTQDTKNLVLIYAEGLERTFFDETIFPG